MLFRSEMSGIPFAQGRIVWKAADFDEMLLTPRPKVSNASSQEWLLGEALTTLYVGMGRYRRGEKLSAARFVQGFAVDRIIDLASYIETEQAGYRDPFTAERRFEQRFPIISRQFPQFVPGYEHTPAAAKAILAFLEQHFEVNTAMKTAILALCEA